MEQKEQRNWIVGLLGISVGMLNPMADDDEQELADNRINSHMQKAYPTLLCQNN